MTYLEYALALEERLINTLGKEELLESLTRSLSTYDLIDNYHYIARMHDIDIDDLFQKL